MKEILQRYAAYNVWANHKVIFAMEALSTDQWYQEVPSSFNTLFKTVFHIWDAESAWWQRIRLHQQIIVPSKTFDPMPKDACNGWFHQSMQWEEFIKSNDVTEEVLASTLQYKNFKGEEFTQPVSDILMHVFNHTTYHRGQLITMLHAVKADHVPNTDFIAWGRSL